MRQLTTILPPAELAARRRELVLKQRETAQRALDARNRRRPDAGSVPAPAPRNPRPKLTEGATP